MRFRRFSGVLEFGGSGFIGLRRTLTLSPNS